MATTELNDTKAAPDVDASLLAVIGSASAPRAVPKSPPLPDSLPGTNGFIAAVTTVFKTLRNGTAFNNEMRETYGDIYRAPFAGYPTVFVWDADEILRMLKNEDRAWSCALGWDALAFGGIDPHAQNSGVLSALDFEDHRVARKLVQPAFTPRAIESYLRMADGHFAEAVATWTASGKVAFKREMRSLLARVAVEIFTGIRDPQGVAKVDRALTDFWRGMLSLSRNPRLSPTFRRSRAGMATLVRTFLELVPVKRQTPGEDLLSQLAASPDAELGDEALVRVFISIMFGAFDTTTGAMTSMAYLLAKHPAWQERLCAEAQAVGSEPPNAAAMKNMKEHEWVWKETLRLMPVGGFVPRRALREVTVAGHRLAPGTMVVPMNGSIGRHPRWWKNPDVFDPERFSPERAEDKQHGGIYNPFGTGAHACIGMQVANMESKRFWHRMLTSCRSFRLARDYEARHTFTPMGVVSGDVELAIDRA